jgi:hypothetical protein
MSALDFNDDGQLDVNDVTYLRSNAESVGAAGDLNADGVINEQDISLLWENIEKQGDSPVEPQSGGSLPVLPLLALAGLAYVAYRRGL